MLFANSLISLLKHQLSDCCSVLDVGCGRSSPLGQIKNSLFKVGVDFCEPYLIKSKQMSIRNCYVLGNVRDLPFKSKSFDLAMASEVIEHLSKDDGLRMIREMERVSTKKIVLTTPNGFLQASAVFVEDNPKEKHISGWNINELKALGFKVFGFNGFKMLSKQSGVTRCEPGTIFGIFKKIIKILFIKSASIVYYFPSLAFQLFCVKNLKKYK